MPGLVLTASFGKAVWGQTGPQEVTFASGSLTLHGFLSKPAGDGPFPAILWNHGSEKLPGSQPALASFYTTHGYVFLIPHRRGQGRSPGSYIQDLIAQAPPAMRAQRMIDLQEESLDDVMAALIFLKAQPLVKPGKIAVSGCSYGGIQTLLAGERDLGIKALVPFAPGAMSWDKNPAVAGRLRRAASRAKAPVFELQAQNDYSLGPSQMLEKESAKRGKDLRAKIYPAFGSTHQEGHWGFCSNGMNVWGRDVLTFLEEQMKNPE